jgi:hypothetical protein
MVKSTPTKKTSFGFAGKPSKPAQGFNPGRFLSGITPAHYPKGFHPSVKAIIESIELVDWLRKKHSDDDAAMDLADRLDNCEPKKRCWSAACPCCAYAAQAFTTEVALKFLTAHPDRDKIVCVSVVPADGQIPAGHLDPDQHDRNTRRWKEALGRAGVTWFLGATDWSFNEHKNGRYHESWLEHFYGFTVTDDPKKLRRSLKEQFPPTDAIPRPVQMKSWDGDKTAIDYMMKPSYPPP